MPNGAPRPARGPVVDEGRTVIFGTALALGGGGQVYAEEGGVLTEQGPCRIV